MSDVLKRAQGGDAAAMEELLAELAPRVHRFCHRLCGGRHDTEDVLQETLLSIAQHLPDFEERSSLASWVFALARSACVRRRRGLKNEPNLRASQAPEPADPAASPEHRAAGSELLDALSSSLAALSDEAREVILLRDVEGLSAADSAAALGISEEALKSRLHRARIALRERMKPWLEPEPQPARIDCPDIMSLWSKKLEGELNRLDCAQMEHHVKGCAHCGAACSALKQALDLCRSAGSGDVPPAVQWTVKRAVRAWAAERHDR